MHDTAWQRPAPNTPIWRFSMYTSAFRNVTMQSPDTKLLRLPTGLSMGLSGDSLWYSYTRSSSPVKSHSRCNRSRADGSPHRCRSRAGRPSTARVHAHPRSGHPIIWISSNTPTSTSSSTSHNSIVDDVCLAPICDSTSCPAQHMQMTRALSIHGQAPSIQHTHTHLFAGCME